MMDTRVQELLLKWNDHDETKVADIEELVDAAIQEALFAAAERGGAAAETFIEELDDGETIDSEQLYERVAKAVRETEEGS